MTTYNILADIHTHSISSGHGSSDTLTGMIKCARTRGLTLLGISEHGPDTPGSCTQSYFCGIPLAPKYRMGVKILYGAELNIRDTQGHVDLPDEILCKLDYAIISMHPPVFSPRTDSLNTDAYIHAMEHPGVRFIGHADDGRYPVDYERLLQAAKDHHVFPEINNASLLPDAYRTNGYENSQRILALCKTLSLPVLLSSDSHGCAHVGDMSHILPLLSECDFPPHLLLNSDPERICRICAGIWE